MDAGAQFRRRLACEQCRSLKVKCIQVDAESKCLKCTKSGHECLIPNRRQGQGMSIRKRRTRLADLDSKLNGIIAQLSTSATEAVGSSMGTMPSFGADINEFTLPSVQPVDMTWPDLPTFALDQHSESNEHSTTETDQSWVSDLNLSPALVDILLDRFRTTQSYFPFVIIGTECRALRMMKERPFLLLTAVASAASSYPHLQEVLRKEIKDTLARRLVVAGENDLDLLQGLLVHLAWYHHHMIPRSQQAYRLLQIAISMLVDFGLDQRPDSVHEERVDIYFRDPSLRPHQRAAGQTSIDAIRASLGCFYLSSIISAHMSKPNALPFNDHVFESAARLKQDAEFESDRTIQPLIKLQQIIEGVREAYRLDKAAGACSRLSLHAERFMSNLDEWRCSLPQDPQYSGLFLTRYHAAKIWIYEMGLIYNFGVRSSFVFKDNYGVAALPNSAMLITNFTKCVDAIKEYLDCFQSMDPATDDRLPLDEWFRFILAFFVAYKLSVRMTELPNWDVNFARETIDLEVYFSSFVDRFRFARSEHISSAAVSGDDLYSAIPEILDSAKASYRLGRDWPQEVQDNFRVHIDLAVPRTQSLTRSSSDFSHTTRHGKCPVTGFWRRQASRADSNDEFNWLVPPDEMDPSFAITTDQTILEQFLDM